MSCELAAIVVAAGASRRMGFDKLTASLLGKPLISYTLEAFEKCPEVDHIVLVCSAERTAEFEAITKEFPKVRKVVAGGRERVDSVLCGMAALDKPVFVAVQDGARPLITPDAIWGCYAAAREHGASACATPVSDTLHRVDGEFRTVETVSRKNLWQMQTPQILEYEALSSLLEEVREAGGTITDEISLLIRQGGKARIFDNPDWNFKVTYPRDLALAELILKDRQS